VGSMTPVSWLRDFTIRILEEQIEDIILQGREIFKHKIHSKLST